MKKNRQHTDGFRKRKIGTDLLSESEGDTNSESMLAMSGSEEEGEDKENEPPQVREHLARQMGQTKPNRGVRKRSGTSLSEDVAYFNEQFLKNQVNSEIFESVWGRPLDTGS